MNKQLIVIGIGFILVGFILSYIRRKLVGYIVKKSPELAISEKFNPKKFLKGFALTDPVLWTKSIFEIIDLRKLIIYALIALTIFGFGYYKNWQNTPIKIDLGYGKEAVIDLGNGEYMHITKDGEVHIQNSPDPKSTNILRTISIKDIPNLKAKLAPIGLQFKPIIVAGMSAGANGGGTEVGAGISFFRFYKMQAEAFITTHPAIYLGTSYSITDNAGIGIAIGKSLSDTNDTRIMIYGRVNF